MGPASFGSPESDTVTATANIRYRGEEKTGMVIVDLGIPPGFTVQSEDLDAARAAGKIAKFEVTGRQVIVYLQGLEPGGSLTLTYRFRARFPIRAKAPASSVYEYYNPTNKALARPVEFQVA